MSHATSSSLFRLNWNCNLYNSHSIMSIMIVDKISCRLKRKIEAHSWSSLSQWQWWSTTRFRNRFKRKIKIIDVSSLSQFVLSFLNEWSFVINLLIWRRFYMMKSNRERALNKTLWDRRTHKRLFWFWTTVSSIIRNFFSIDFPKLLLSAIEVWYVSTLKTNNW